MTGKNEIYVEKRTKERDYAVRLPSSERASGTAKTQAEAIAMARKMHPEATVLVERVRHEGAGPDKWRPA